MRLKSRGLGRKELVMDFREYTVTRDGDDIVIQGAIREPVHWDFSIRMCQDDLGGLARIALSKNTLGFLIKALFTRDKGAHWSVDRETHLKDVKAAIAARAEAENAPADSKKKDSAGTKKTPASSKKDAAKAEKTPDSAKKDAADTKKDAEPADTKKIPTSAKKLPASAKRKDSSSTSARSLSFASPTKKGPDASDAPKKDPDGVDMTKKDPSAADASTTASDTAEAKSNGSGTATSSIAVLPRAQDRSAS